MFKLTYQFRRRECFKGGVTEGRKRYKTFATHAEREAFTEQLLKDGCYKMWSHPVER